METCTAIDLGYKWSIATCRIMNTGLDMSELSKSVPELLLYHPKVPELTLNPPLNSQNSRPCEYVGLFKSRSCPQLGGVYMGHKPFEKAQHFHNKSLPGPNNM